MSEPVKLLFDECLGMPLVEKINDFLAMESPKPVLHHLLQYFQAGTSDAVWIPQIAKEGWIIITADMAKQSNNMKLPTICQQYKITHILMTSSVLKLKQSEKALAVLRVWKDIKKCQMAPAGTRFLLHLNHDHNATITRQKRPSRDPQPKNQ